MFSFAEAQLVTGGVCIAVGLVHLTIGVQRLQSRAYLAFALVAVMSGLEALAAPAAYSAATIEELTHAYKWLMGIQATQGLSMVWFVRSYAGVKDLKAVWLITTVCCVHQLILLLSPDLIHHVEITALQEHALPWGERFVLPVGEPGWAAVFGHVLGIVIIVFSLAVCSYLWRNGARDKARRLTLALSFELAAIVHGFLIDIGSIHSPYLYSFGFLGFVLLMNFELGRDVVRVSILTKDIRENERRWRALLEQVSLLVVGQDSKRVINYVNPYCSVTGFSDKELLGRKFSDLIHPSDRGRIAGLSDLDTDKDVHLRTLTKDGESRLVNWFSVILRDRDGFVSGLFRIGADITEQNAAEEAKGQALRELQALKEQLEEENFVLREELHIGKGEVSRIIGKSDPIQYVVHKIQQVAPTEATVLIEGETGVGKELVARAIHDLGSRSRRPFVSVNCGALPPSLVASELFGHERGAFTGADRLRKGRFELADGSTVFLDEVGELPLEIQTNLLRAVQEGEFERVGSSVTRKVDVRIISATNRNLEQEVSEGRFRQDLFYRLCVYPITVPPLRDRPGDIPLLVNHYVQELSAKHRKQFETMPAHFMRDLTRYHWPGNVRELINVLERAVITSSGTVLRLPEPLKKDKALAELGDGNGDIVPLEELERHHIARILDLTRWRISGPEGAARLLGINASTLRSRIKKLKIERKAASGGSASHS